MENSKRNPVKQLVLAIAMCYSLGSPHAVVSAASALTVEDLPAPYNLQAVVHNQSATLNWTWDPPTPSPQFQTFSYEVYRDTGVVAMVPKTAFTDFALNVGSHGYKVRLRGMSKDMGKKVTHLSAWSEPAEIKIVQTCGGPPLINLKVASTQQVYGAIHNLRLHFTGDVKVPTGCTLDGVMYHIDSGMSTERTGPLKIDSKGRFDEFIDAMGPEDESITGSATFNITVTAKDELSGASSGVFSIDLQREDPYAPKTQNKTQ